MKTTVKEPEEPAIDHEALERSAHASRASRTRWYNYKESPELRGAASESNRKAAKVRWGAASWSAEDDRLILCEGYSVAELCKRLKRSPMAITMRRFRLKRQGQLRSGGLHVGRPPKVQAGPIRKLKRVNKGKCGGCNKSLTLTHYDEETGANLCKDCAQGASLVDAKAAAR